MRFRNKFALFGITLVLLSVGYLYVTASWNAAEIARRDQQIARDVDAALAARLMRLSPDDPISRRYGKLVRISGTGCARHPGMINAPQVILPRRIEFEKGTVETSVSVGYRGPIEFNMRMMPSEEFADDHPELQIVKVGSQLRLAGKDQWTLSTIEIFSPHPLYVSSGSDLNDAREMQAKTDQPIVGLIEAVGEGKTEPVQSTSAWLASQDDSKTVEAFVRRAFEQTDPEVRLQAAKMLGETNPGKSLALNPATRSMLLAYVVDPNEDVAARDQLLRLLLRSDRRSPTELFERLAEMEDGGRFAIPAVVAFLSDPNQSHWTLGGAASAPTEAVKFLQSLGADGKPAVPILTQFVAGHPNAWSFRGVAADALGAIGPDAKSAIETLNMATSSSYGNLREAAERALVRIDPDTLLPSDYEVGFESENVQQQFYPFWQNEAFYWLSDDGAAVLMTHRNAGAVYQIDRRSRQATHAFDIDTDGLQSVYAMGDRVLALRLVKSDAGCEVFVDIWSMAAQKSVDKHRLMSLPLIQKGQRINLDLPTWNPDGSRVAFESSTSTPVAGQPNRFRRTTALHVFDVKAAKELVTKKPTEYLTGPIGFSHDSKTLYLYGQLLGSGSSGVVMMDIDSMESQTIANSDLGNHNAHNVVFDNSFVFGSRSRESIPYIDLRIKARQELQLESDVAYRFRPWRIEVLAFPVINRIAAFTEFGIEQRDASTGERIRRTNIFSPEGRGKISSAATVRDGATIILIGTSQSAAMGRTALYVREFELIPVTP